MTNAQQHRRQLQKQGRKQNLDVDFDALCSIPLAQQQLMAAKMDGC